MHDGKHHGRCGQIVEIGGNHECEQCYRPDETPGVSRAHPFAYEIETAVVVQYLYYGHRGKQKQYDRRRLAKIHQKYMVIDIILDGLA